MSKEELRLVRLPVVEELTGLKKSEIYDRISRGEFPRQVPLGPKTVAWVLHEVQAYVADLVRQRDERLAFQESGGPATR